MEIVDAINCIVSFVMLDYSFTPYLYLMLQGHTAQVVSAGPRNGSLS